MAQMDIIDQVYIRSVHQQLLI